MNVAIYHPSMHNMGGGETVALSIASILQKDHQVTIYVNKSVDKAKLEHFFDLDLTEVTFKVFGQHITNFPGFGTLKQSLLARSLYSTLDRYDLVIDTCSNGIFEKKLGKKSICYVHFPNFSRQKKGLKSIFNPFLIKKENMFAYDSILCNSKFTQNYVKQLTKNKTHVVYPPVKTEHIKVKKKKNTIITIGRYSPEKKHEIMIKAYILGKFKEELHIVGASGDEEYYDMLQNIAKDHNITFHKDVPHKKVLDMLSTAKFYWHSRGYGETDPIQYENFGITTAEAIAAGCIPIVINLGAQPEIIKLVGIGYTWNTPDELISKTKKAKSAKAKNIFSFEKFKNSFLKFI